MWVHQFQPSPRFADAFEPDEPEPRYQNWLVLNDNGALVRNVDQYTFQRVQLPVFSRAFMLKTYETVVTVFEEECVARGTAPVID